MRTGRQTGCLYQPNQRVSATLAGRRLQTPYYQDDDRDSGAGGDAGDDCYYDDGGDANDDGGADGDDDEDRQDKLTIKAHVHRLHRTFSSASAS